MGTTGISLLLDSLLQEAGLGFYLILLLLLLLYYYYHYYFYCYNYYYYYYYYYYYNKICCIPNLLAGTFHASFF